MIAKLFPCSNDLQDVKQSFQVSLGSKNKKMNKKESNRVWKSLEYASKSLQQKIGFIVKIQLLQHEIQERKVSNQLCIKIWYTDPMVPQTFNNISQMMLNISHNIIKKILLHILRISPDVSQNLNNVLHVFQAENEGFTCSTCKSNQICPNST